MAQDRPSGRGWGGRRLGLAVVALLVVVTSVALATAQPWLVPPYLALTAWLLFGPPHSGGRAARPTEEAAGAAPDATATTASEANQAAEASTRADQPTASRAKRRRSRLGRGFGGANANASDAASTADAGSTTSGAETAVAEAERSVGESGSESTVSTPSRSKRRRRKRARATEPEPDPSQVTWVRVGPNKFVRRELPPGGFEGEASADTAPTASAPEAAEAPTPSTPEDPRPEEIEAETGTEADPAEDGKAQADAAQAETSEETEAPREAVASWFDSALEALSSDRDDDQDEDQDQDQDQDGDEENPDGGAFARDDAASEALEDEPGPEASEERLEDGADGQKNVNESVDLNIQESKRILNSNYERPIDQEDDRFNETTVMDSEAGGGSGVVAERPEEGSERVTAEGPGSPTEAESGFDGGSGEASLDAQAEAESPPARPASASGGIAGYGQDLDRYLHDLIQMADPPGLRPMCAERPARPEEEHGAAPPPDPEVGAQGVGQPTPREPEAPATDDRSSTADDDEDGDDRDPPRLGPGLRRNRSCFAQINVFEHSDIEATESVPARGLEYDLGRAVRPRVGLRPSAGAGFAAPRRCRSPPARAGAESPRPVRLLSTRPAAGPRPRPEAPAVPPPEVRSAQGRQKRAGGPALPPVGRVIRVVPPGKSRGMTAVEHPDMIDFA